MQKEQNLRTVLVMGDHQQVPRHQA